MCVGSSLGEEQYSLEGVECLVYALDDENRDQANAAILRERGCG